MTLKLKISPRPETDTHSLSVDRQSEQIARAGKRCVPQALQRWTRSSRRLAPSKKGRISGVIAGTGLLSVIESLAAVTVDVMTWSNAGSPLSGGSHEHARTSRLVRQDQRRMCRENPSVSAHQGDLRVGHLALAAVAAQLDDGFRNRRHAPHIEG